MPTIALIGGDGAGKTTISNKLMASFPSSLKYLYMGTNAHSSNFALPTSRLIYFFKRLAYKKEQEKAGKPSSAEFISTHDLGHSSDKRGKLGATARMLNRLLEEWLRQIISWSYQARGHIVLYDRHCLFDFAPKPNNPKKRLSDRIHYSMLSHLYPKPDMVFFLDAPPEVLFARKGEASVEYLRSKRETYLNQGKKMNNFFQIDVTQSVDKVFADITRHIDDVLGEQRLLIESKPSLKTELSVAV